MLHMQSSLQTIGVSHLFQSGGLLARELISKETLPVENWTACSLCLGLNRPHLRLP